MIASAMISLALATAPPAGFCKCKVPARTFTKKVTKKTIVQTKGESKEAIVYSSPSTINYSSPRPNFGIGGRAAIGFTTCRPNVYAQVGLRVRFFPAHLGLDLSTQFAYGFGAALLVYPYQGDTVSWHLNGGVLFGGQNTYSMGSLPRKLDVTVGTGLEYRLPVRWLSLTADYRLTAPPVPGVVVWGNSALRSQLMFGLMAHTW